MPAAPLVSAIGLQNMTEEATTAAGWTVRKLAKVVIIGFGLLIGALLAVLAVFSWWASHGIFASSHFDPNVWFAKQTNETDSTCYRGGMAEDIKKRLLKPGMTHADVERILGKPDSRAMGSEYRYTLGMCSGFKMDYDDLHVYFDASGQYKKAIIIQH